MRDVGEALGRVDLACTVAWCRVWTCGGRERLDGREEASTALGKTRSRFSVKFPSGGDRPQGMKGRLPGRVKATF